jgi:hypothetical protein
MAREFKPVRFIFLITVVAFVVCGVTAFYTTRGSFGHSSDERAGYAAGVSAARQALAGAKLPNAAELNTLAQRRFKEVGSGNQQEWDLGFERGYEDSFNKSHR